MAVEAPEHWICNVCSSVDADVLFENLTRLPDKVVPTFELVVEGAAKLRLFEVG